MLTRGSRPALLFSSTILLPCALAFAACAAGNSTGSGSTEGAGGAATGAGGAGGMSVGGAGGAGGSMGEDGGLWDVSQPDTGTPLDTLIYAHTGDTLFSLDPKSLTLSLKQEGVFDCVGTQTGQVPSMTDLAVDQDGKVWGISASAVHPLTIQNGSAHCGTPIVLNNPSGVKFFGLTFAPAGVLHPSNEVLVAGNTAGELWSIDGLGNLKLIGNFGQVPAPYPNAGTNWALSGDIVFLANNGSPVGFAAARDCSDPSNISTCNPVDTLLEIDVTKLSPTAPGVVTKSIRGSIDKRAGCNDPVNTGYGRMYGIAAWNDKVYGFSYFGQLVEIDTGNGSACLVKEYTGTKFAGAGVTTLAPYFPPPK